MLLDLLKKSAIFIVIGIAIIIFFLLNRDGPSEPASEFSPVTATQKEDDAQENESDNQLAIVDVKGEVVHPGVYEIEMDARVDDVIELAGGFADQADQSVINLAQKVQDEMVILIPKKGEVAADAPSATGQSSGNEKIKLNQATQAEIETLSGIGPSKAEAIIQYREENGLFQMPEDLLEISGIGEKTLENLKDDIQVP